MQALHRREAPAAAGRGTPQAAGLFPDQSEEEKPIVQFQQGGRGRSQSHHGPGSGGRSCWPRGLGSELGFRTSVLLSSEAGGRWHTVPGTQLPAMLRHEQAPSLAPPFPEQQLWSHPDSKLTVGAGEGSSEGDLSLHTLRQRGFRLKSFILIEFSEWKLPNIAALCRNILALRAPASRGNFHRFEYFTSFWTDRQWGARVQKAAPAADPAMLAQLTGFSATAMLLRGSPHLWT